jgi:hypothetical protein
LFLLDRRQLHHHPHADHVPLREKQALVNGNRRRSPLVTGNAPVTDQVLQITQER